jgi:hypothetical protein
VEKARTRGKEVKRCRCCELVKVKELKIADVKASHIRGEEKVVPKEREVHRRREVCEWEG